MSNCNTQQLVVDVFEAVDIETVVVLVLLDVVVLDVVVLDVVVLVDVWVIPGQSRGGVGVKLNCRSKIDAGFQ